MKKYKYIRIEGEKKIFSINFINYVGHRDIIDEQARKGYRYVGYIPIGIRGNGGISSIDLIFEKEE